MAVALFVNGVCVGALAVIIYDLCCLASAMKRGEKESNEIENDGY